MRVNNYRYGTLTYIERNGSEFRDRVNAVLRNSSKKHSHVLLYPNMISRRVIPLIF